MGLKLAGVDFAEGVDFDRQVLDPNVAVGREFLHGWRFGKVLRQVEHGRGFQLGIDQAVATRH